MERLRQRGCELRAIEGFAAILNCYVVVYKVTGTNSILQRNCMDVKFNATTKGFIIAAVKDRKQQIRLNEDSSSEIRKIHPKTYLHSTYPKNCTHIPTCVCKCVCTKGNLNFNSTSALDETNVQTQRTLTCTNVCPRKFEWN